MESVPKISSRTRQNWWLDSALFLSGIIASLTGVYFLFFVVGGYQGGRNSLYQVTFLMPRSDWDLWHTWTGIAMIAVASLHIVLHWDWIRRAVQRSVKIILTGKPKLKPQVHLNILINAAIGLSFVITAVSGVYFLFFPGGPARMDPGLLFSRTTWDLIHTWGGVVLLLAALAHFYIHWGWVVKVPKNMVSSFLRLFRKSSEVTQVSNLP